MKHIQIIVRRHSVDTFCAMVKYIYSTSYEHEDFVGNIYFDKMEHYESVLMFKKKFNISHILEVSTIFDEETTVFSCIADNTEVIWNIDPDPTPEHIAAEALI